MALVLGFPLSGAVQAFVSRGEMRQAPGEHRPDVPCWNPTVTLPRQLSAGGFTHSIVLATPLVYVHACGFVRHLVHGDVRHAVTPAPDGPAAR